jgi:hypothetical protein
MRTTQHVRFSIAFPRSNVDVFSRRSDHVALLDDQNRPEDPLCLSTQQSRLIRQTWTSSPFSSSSTPAGTPCNMDAEAQTSSRPPRHRRSLARHGSGAGPKDSKFAAAASVSRPDNSVFRHLKNIEKVCRTVDERIQKKKDHKEWSTKMISDAARLGRDEEDSENVPGEWTQPNRDADRATLDHDSNPDDRPQAGTTQSPEAEVVPTSLSLERYLSLSPLSQTAPTGSLDAAPCAQIGDDRVDVAATDWDIMSSLTSLSSSEEEESQPSQTS